MDVSVPAGVRGQMLRTWGGGTSLDEADRLLRGPTYPCAGDPG